MYTYTIFFLLSSQFELKKSLVDHLVHLLSCGHVLSVVDYVAQCTEMESLDQTHIRHFVVEVRTAIQCSPQTRWKAYWESIFWVELVSTSKF